MYVINSGKFSESSDFKKLFVLPHYSQIALSKFPLKALVVRERALLFSLRKLQLSFRATPFFLSV